LKILPGRPRRPSLLPFGPRALALLGGILASLCVACSSAPPVQTLSPESLPIPSGPPLLEKGVVQEREIRDGEIHEYRIAAQAGDYARVTVDQKGADVALRLVGPSGEEVAALDSVGGRKEGELVSWIAQKSGDFRLFIAPHEPDEAGLYKLTLEELRPSRTGDTERVLAERTYLEAYHWLALQDQDSRAKALAKLQESLALWQSIGDHSREIEALNLIGPIHRNRGEAVFALALYNRALALARQSADRRGEAQTLNNLAVAHHQLSQYKVAIQELQEARQIWEELDDQDELANTLYGLGVLQYDSNELGAALESFNRALDLRRTMNHADGQAPVLTGIATIYRERGEGDKALAMYRQALDLSRAVKDRNDEAIVLQNMGSIYLRRGEVQEALELYTDALEIHRALGNRASEGRVLSYLGTTSLYLGDREQALAHYNQALQIHRELSDEIREAYTLRDVGWAYDLRGEPQVALEHYTRANEIGLKLNDRRIQAYAIHGMGRAQRVLGAPREAVVLLERAVAFFQEEGSPLGEVNSMVDLGLAYQALPDPQRAAELFYRARDLSRQRKTLIAEANAQAAVARLERERGNLPAAAVAIKEAQRIVESIRPKVATQRQRVSFFASRRGYYDFDVDLQMRLHERDPAGGHLATALAVSERARARGLLDLLAEGRLDVRRGISAELKQREEETENRISLLQGDLLDDLSGEGKQAARIEAELDRAEEDRERIEWQIQREHPHYAAFRNPAPLPLERIQGMLDDRTALLEYSIGEESSCLFVVTRDRLEGFRIPPSSEIAELVETLRGTLGDPGRRYRTLYIEAAYRLYEILLAPAWEMLRGKPHLIVSPDGPLLLLSFEALLTSSDSGGSGYAGLPYLIREKSVTYVPSASVFAELGASAEGAIPAAVAAVAAVGTSLFMGFADPAYERASPAPGPAAAGPLARTLQDAGLPAPQRLTHSRGELLEIASLFPPGQVRSYFDGDASEENVKANPDLRNARWLHFAVHGFVDEARPEYSGLVLSLDGDSKENGLLQVYEIFNLDLSADLVVLSACETALGKNVRGEGLLGVSRALLYAGAASVVVSLWQVADASTSDLMVRFYRHLMESGDKAEALRLSKLEMIEDGRYDRPYHWAPFILIGRPGSDVTLPHLARQ
jgi:CHAT domain-containing protein/Flp pilus assembly protein TadD